MRSSADESVRERMAKFGARQHARQMQEQQQQLSWSQSHAQELIEKGEEGGVPLEALVATTGRRHLLRGPGSWTNGSATGSGGVKSPRLLSRSGSAGESGSSLGSPSSSSNLVNTQAALGNLTNNLASLISTKSQMTSGNRESRRQSMTRRLARGVSLGTGRTAAAARDMADLGAVEEAEAVALGASPAAARAAADAAVATSTESLAIRRQLVEKRLAGRRSLGHQIALEMRQEQPVALSTVLDEGVVDHHGTNAGPGGAGGVGAAPIASSPCSTRRPGRLLPATDTVFESDDDEEYATPRWRKESSESGASVASSTGGGDQRQQQQQGEEPSAPGGDSSGERGGGGGGRKFFANPQAAGKGRRSTGASSVRVLD